jgi:release factor glutamine methyltransferase
VVHVRVRPGSAVRWLVSDSPHSAVVSKLRAAGCVFAEDEADLLLAAATTPAELDSLVDRRVAGLPLEHLLGWAEFHGLRITVGPGVFVPRHRTEFLVDVAVALAPPDPVVLDLCCGSGALGAAFAAAVRPRELHAADVEPAAVRCARVNLPGAHVYEGDLYDVLPASLRGRVDVLLANVPYVPSDAVATMPPEARLHEPLVALDGGADGLDLARRVAAGAPGWLVPGGVLVVESSERQAPVVEGIFAAAGLRPGVHVSGEQGATVVSGTA